MRKIWILAAALMSFSVGCSESSPSTPSVTTTTAPPPVTASVSSGTVEVVERNDVFWAFSWRAVITANRAGVCTLVIKFFDDRGIELDEGRDSLQVQQGAHTHTGRSLVNTDLARRVTNYQMQIDSCR